MKKVVLILVLLCFHVLIARAQHAVLQGNIRSEGISLAFVQLLLEESQQGTSSDVNGFFEIRNVKPGNYHLLVQSVGYEGLRLPVRLYQDSVVVLDISLQKKALEVEEVVITGTMNEVTKRESPVPIEVYSPKFFRANPSPSIIESMQNINGVRPQINCSVCNTGDIHINGLEGAYTMVLIDGMPIVSGLSTVYGLFGIPAQLIERVEIVKGPASSLYGSEAMGGIINVITKKPDNAPLFAADIQSTSWLEHNADLAMRFKLGEKAQSLLGINYFNYSLPIDNNGDNFTDMTLQDRVSIFNKWSFRRKDNKLMSFAARYVHEDRWGGEMQWNPSHRGGREVYGESIYTNRLELLGSYQLPGKEDIYLNFSGNLHQQDAAYGDMAYIGEQHILFGQLHWNKRLGSAHQLLLGSAIRYTWYDDNSPVTAFMEDGRLRNSASETYLPGFFIQDEVVLNKQNKLLLGMRYDYNSLHGNIFSPRVNYKWNSIRGKSTLRLSAGNGFRVANVFTEDHAALTGARSLVFQSELQPERSWNGNLNFVQRIYGSNKFLLNLDATAFYTYFDNRIIADYDSDPNLVLYDNLDGHAVSQGISLNLDLSYQNLKIIAGATFMDVNSIENGIKTSVLFTESFSGTWNASYEFPKARMQLHYTGNVYGPMRLPLLGPLDLRPEYSPVWSIQNLQISKAFKKSLEVYAGVKNLLNWTPAKSTPFLIARANDPFDNTVSFNSDNQVVPDAGNPYGLSFDPTYMYAPMQGIRAFFGLRYTIE